jgi:hypothetical protein
MNHNQLIVDDYRWPMGHPKASNGKTLGKPTPFDRLLIDQVFVMPQWQIIHPNCGVGIFLVVVGVVLNYILEYGELAWPK